MVSSQSVGAPLQVGVELFAAREDDGTQLSLGGCPVCFGLAEGLRRECHRVEAVSEVLGQDARHGETGRVRVHSKGPRPISSSFHVCHGE